MRAAVTAKRRGSVSKTISSLSDLRVTVGVHESEGSAVKSAPDGEDPGQSLIDVANKHEFGLGVPRRSFIGDWFDSARTESETVLRKIAQAGVKLHRPVETSASRFGVWAVGQIQGRIAAGIPPELSEQTKAYKASLNLAGNRKDTPLILTGQLWSSIRSKVERVSPGK